MGETHKSRRKPQHVLTAPAAEMCAEEQDYSIATRKHPAHKVCVTSLCTKQKGSKTHREVVLCNVCKIKVI